MGGVHCKADSGSHTRMGFCQLRFQSGQFHNRDVRMLNLMNIRISVIHLINILHIPFQSHINIKKLPTRSTSLELNSFD
jgi:hypothetical protein